MSSNLVVSLCRSALGIALRRPAPSSIPRTGDKAESVNCYVAQIGGTESDWPFMAKELVDGGVTGLWWDGDSYKIPCSIPNWQLRLDNFQFAHYIGHYDFESTSVLSFLIQELSRWRYFLIFKDKFGQFLYNQRKLVRKDRIEVLRLTLEGTVKNRRFAMHSTTLMGALYSNRWVFHPEKDEYLAYCSFLLDSLAGSGDLAKDGISYKIAPKALTTLAEYERDERKHRDQVLQQRALKWLTVALVVVGAAQVYVSYAQKQT